MLQRRADRPLSVQSVCNVELTCNPSSFSVYCAVRRSVLSSFMQQLSASLSQIVTSVESDSDIDADDVAKSCSDTSTHRLPKVND